MEQLEPGCSEWSGWCNCMRGVWGKQATWCCSTWGTGQGQEGKRLDIALISNTKWEGGFTVVRN